MGGGGGLSWGDRTLTLTQFDPPPAKPLLKIPALFPVSEAAFVVITVFYCLYESETRLIIKSFHTFTSILISFRSMKTHIYHRII